VKLKVFFAGDGDCLLLTSADGHHALIDGGRTDPFRKNAWPVLQTFAAAGERIDLVIVSHIDADHISGVLWLMRQVAAWTRFDFQTNEGNNPNPKLKPPKVPRPPRIDALWHNSWRAQLGALADPVEALVGRVSDGLETASYKQTRPAMEAIGALQDLAESIPDGIDLLRTVDEDTPVARNAGFKQDLVMLRDPLHVETLGSMKLRVIGPGKQHLKELQDEWRKWLDTAAGKKAAREQAEIPTRRDAQGPSLGVTGHDFLEARATERAEAEALVTSIAENVEIIHTTDPTEVTPPNRASITVLAEESGRTCLLTGDAAEEEILDGLKAAKRLDGGPFRCNVVKVQHHGSEFNLSETFAKQVIGEHYVFCADGANENPDPAVVKTVVETRLAVDPSPFTVWFNCSPKRTLPNRRASLRAGIAEATNVAATRPEVTVNVLADDEPFFEIDV
jgi:beta-lactamase superfamily II metal-dependent hydrolase